MNIKHIVNKIKDVKPRDYLSVFPMLAGLAISPFYKKKYKDYWAICERKDEARDNGYHLFRYISTKHPEIKCIYAISSKCEDYKKVRSLGETVKFGSIKHWIVYFTARWLISSQSFHPNGYVCTFIERIGLYSPDHVFLQHGITKDKAEFLLAENRRARFFIAGAKPEYDFMDEEFGYPKGTMRYTGFARFDALHNYHTAPNRILVMPTWRKWLKLKSEEHKDATSASGLNEYRSYWKNVFTSKKLQEIIKEYDLDIIFYPHPNMVGMLDLKSIVGENITIADTKKCDLQELMKSSEMIITDYSSVFFDMAYMKKPIIFYQFDEKKYRKYHYQQGWFDYHNTALGAFCSTHQQVIDELEGIVKSGYRVSDEFINEHKQIFPLYDTKNCERIFKLLFSKTKKGEIGHGQNHT